MTAIAPPAALERLSSAVELPAPVLSCSLCWSGQGDVCDPGSGAWLCVECAREAGRIEGYAETERDRHGRPGSGSAPEGTHG
jgi:hypothetical protein